MSRQSSGGHWETQSSSYSSTQTGNNPPQVSGQESSSEGTYNHGQPVVTDSHATSFTNQGHPNRLEFRDEGGIQ